MLRKLIDLLTSLKLTIVCLAAAIVPVQAGEIRFSTVDLSGATARTLAGWMRRDGRAWFFKMTGPKPVVEQEKAKFVAFLQSVRF